MQARAILLLLIMQLTACVGCCPDYDCSYGELLEIELRAFNNGDKEPFEVLSDSIPAKALMLKLTYKGSKTECPDETAEIRNYFTNAAFAFSCPDNLFESPDTVDSIFIKSTADFNSAFPAGSDLSELFLSRSDYSTAVRWRPEYEKNYLLFSSPEQPTAMHFVVEVKLTSGEVFRDSTGLITLIPG
jgi:hypothetical protein